MSHEVLDILFHGVRFYLLDRGLFWICFHRGHPELGEGIQNSRNAIHFTSCIHDNDIDTHFVLFTGLRIYNPLIQHNDLDNRLREMDSKAGTARRAKTFQRFG